MCYLRFIQPVCLAEEDKTDDKQNDDGANGQTRIGNGDAEKIDLQTLGQLADYGDHSGAYKGSALAADVHRP